MGTTWTAPSREPEYVLFHRFKLSRKFAAGVYFSPSRNIKGLDWAIQLELLEEGGTQLVGLYLHCSGPSGQGNQSAATWSCVTTRREYRFIPSNANIYQYIHTDPTTGHRIFSERTILSESCRTWGIKNRKWMDIVRFFQDGDYLHAEIKFRIEPPTGDCFELEKVQQMGQIGLRQDMLNLFGKTASDCDLTLVSKDGGLVPCHGLVLSARCPVFQAMLSSGLKECTERVMQITDVGTDELKLLVKFLYTGDVRKEVEDVQGIGVGVMKGLLVAADKYGLPQLIKFAAHGLKLRRSPKDAWELLEVLKMYERDIPEFVSEWKQYVVENVKEIVAEV